MSLNPDAFSGGFHGQRRLAVIGAGLAGLACARAARDAGLTVTLFEKSRELGGRLATRRPFGLDDPIGLDHGAPHAEPSARRPETAARLAELGVGWGACWPDAPADAALGVPGMSDLARPLAQGLGEGRSPLAVETGTEIAAIAAGDEDWLLRDAAGASWGPFDAVAVAAPAAQTRALLGEACPPSETEALFAPVMAVMAVFDPAPVGASQAALLEAPVAPLARVWRMGAKPGRRTDGREAWVAHASREWSLAHMEESRESIAAALAPRLLEAIGCGAEDKPVYLAGHRWRYALVEKPIGRAFWISPPEADLPGLLGCCGDWRLGPKAGDALASGALLGAQMAARLRR